MLLICNSSEERVGFTRLRDLVKHYNLTKTYLNHMQISLF